MWSHATLWFFHVEYFTKRFVDLSTAKISSKALNLIDRIIEVLVIVLNAALSEHEFVDVTIATNVESTAVGKTVQEHGESLIGQADFFRHRSTSIDKENVLILYIIFWFFILTILLQFRFLIYLHLLVFTLILILIMLSLLVIIPTIPDLWAKINTILFYARLIFLVLDTLFDCETSIVR